MRSELERQYRGWIDAHCAAVDEFYSELQPFFSADFRRLSFFHFSAKRNDLFPTLTRLIRLQQDSGASADWLSEWDSALSLKNAIRRAWRSVRLFVKLQFFLIWIRCYRLGVDRSEPLQAATLFFTVATERDAEKLNRQYGDVFDAWLEREPSAYLTTFFADGFHVSSSLFSMIRLAKRYFNSKRPMVSLEEFMPLWFPCAGLVDAFRVFLLSFRLRAQSSRISSRLRAAFSAEIDTTLLRIAHYRVIDRLGRVLARSIREKRLLYILFEQNYGKTLFAALRAENRLIGVQHGTYSFLRMGQYFSKQEMNESGYPHAVVAEGENHALALRRHVPALDVRVLGTPRFRWIHTRVSQPSSRKKGWVMLGLHQYRHLIEFVSKACGDPSCDSIHWVIRPHPIDSNASNEVKRSLAKAIESGRVSVSMGSVTWSQEQVDFCLFDDSSIGVELFVSGIPAYFVKPNDREEVLCPLHDYEIFGRATETFEVRSIQDWVASLNRRPIDRQSATNDGFFFANPGNSVLAWVEYLSRS